MTSAIGFEPPEDPYDNARPIRSAIHHRMLSSKQVKALPPPTPLIDGLLALDSLAVLWGRWGGGKTFVTTSIALSVSTGLRWMGHKVTKGPVLYVVGEGVSGMGQRIDAWESYHGTTDSNVVWLPEPIDLLNKVAITELAGYCADLRPSLVVLDTLNRCLSGADENSSAVMSTAVTSMDALRTASGGACVLGVHHPTKDGETARGHGALFGALNTELKLSGANGLLTLETKKQKDGPEAKGVPLQLEPWMHSAVIRDASTLIADTGNPIVGCIRDVFGHDWVSKTDLMAALEMPNNTFWRHTKTLIAEGLLSREQRGRSTYYRITPEAPNA